MVATTPPFIFSPSPFLSKRRLPPTSYPHQHPPSEPPPPPLFGSFFCLCLSLLRLHLQGALPRNNNKFSLEIVWRGIVALEVSSDWLTCLKCSQPIKAVIIFVSVWFELFFLLTIFSETKTMPLLSLHNCRHSPMNSHFKV